MEETMEKTTAGLEALEVIVRESGGSFRTGRVCGQQAGCTHSQAQAVEALAGKLFRRWSVTLLEEYPHSATDNRRSRWKIEGEVG